MDCFDRAIRLKSEYAEAWYNKGEAMRRQDKFIEAIFHFNKAIEIDPSHIKAWKSKALALKALGDDKEAEEAFAGAGFPL